MGQAGAMPDLCSRNTFCMRPKYRLSVWLLCALSRRIVSKIKVKTSWSFNTHPFICSGVIYIKIKIYRFGTCFSGIRLLFCIPGRPLCSFMLIQGVARAQTVQRLGNVLDDQRIDIRFLATESFFLFYSAKIGHRAKHLHFRRV